MWRPLVCHIFSEQTINIVYALRAHRVIYLLSTFSFTFTFRLPHLLRCVHFVCLNAHRLLSISIRSMPFFVCVYSRSMRTEHDIVNGSASVAAVAAAAASAAEASMNCSEKHTHTHTNAELYLFHYYYLLRWCIPIRLLFVHRFWSTLSQLVFRC